MQTHDLGTFIHSLNIHFSILQMRQNKTKTRSQRNVPKVAEVNKAVKSGFQPRRLSAGSSQGTPQPSLDCAFPLIQVQLHHSGGGGGPAPPRSSETFHRPRASAPSGPPPPGRVRTLTRRESGDPRNLAGDLCREHREVLLVAFEVG